MVNSQSDQLEIRRSAANITITRLIAEKFDALQQGNSNLELEHGRYLGFDSSQNDLLFSYSQHDARGVQVFMKQMREEVKWPLGFYHCFFSCTFNSLHAIANSLMIVAGGKEARVGSIDFTVL
ncbi:hypothetical protein E6O75_ATG04603 [Venturia nashicola]|uniref:Uncharacterized protein n=1 Tax=Venturia nashicola TaxID=86259 RepID=A0A4Z1PB30_9PEZI|nr:hypothetical protein E6O75_ATG04603 [Venturia nashicola]